LVNRDSGNLPFDHLRPPIFGFPSLILEGVYRLVKIPHPAGGNNEYIVDAESLFDPVRRALTYRAPSGRQIVVVASGMGRDSRLTAFAVE
jgi:hypothetical protein